MSRVGEYRRYSIGDTVRYSKFEYLYLIFDTFPNIVTYLYLPILRCEIGKILNDALGAAAELHSGGGLRQLG